MWDLVASSGAACDGVHNLQTAIKCCHTFPSVLNGLSVATSVSQAFGIAHCAFPGHSGPFVAHTLLLPVPLNSSWHVWVTPVFFCGLCSPPASFPMYLRERECSLKDLRIILNNS